MRGHPPSARIWAVLGLGAVSFLPGMMVLRATAEIRGTDSLIWPATAAVGTTFRATLDIVNQSTPANDNGQVTIESLFVTPACASASLVVCSASDAELGVFDVRAAVGDAETAPCARVTFSVGSQGPVTGEVQQIPCSTITLGPSNGPAADRTCRVDLDLHVNKLPTHPDGGNPGRTNALADSSPRRELAAEDPCERRCPDHGHTGAFSAAGPHALRVGDDHAGRPLGDGRNRRAAQTNVVVRV
jgi:hypothetical protein